MNRSDLKTGMLVETGDGRLRIVIGNTLVSYIDGGGYDLGWYTSTLGSARDNPDRTIVRVYSEPHSSSGLCSDLAFFLRDKRFLDCSELLWTNPDICNEMTIEDIEEALGKKIKIVGQNNGN